MTEVCMQLSQISQVVATGSMAGSAHLRFGLAACSAAQVGGFLSCPGYLAVDAEKLYLLAPEQQQEPAPLRLSFCGASPAGWESSSRQMSVFSLHLKV